MKITAAGHMGSSASFDGAVVEISRKGMAALVARSRSKQLPVESIMKVHMRPATGLVNGFIQFIEVGGSIPGARGLAQTAESAQSENSVVFTREQQPAFEKLKAHVEQAYRPGWTG